MAIVQKATINMFDQVYSLLQFFEIRGMGRSDWKILLKNQWSSRFTHFGYVLLQQDKVVGFLGTFFYERKINNKRRDFCNLFCWVVLEEHRKDSLRLLFAVLNLQDITVTSLTPSLEAGKILEKFRFKHLETGVKIFPVFFSYGSAKGTVLCSDLDSIFSNLNEEDRILFKNHNPSSCQHLLIINERNCQEYCYIMFNKVRKNHIRFTQVYHVSNIQLFCKTFSPLQRFFFLKNHTFFTIMDQRLLLGHNPGLCIRYSLRYPRLYRSPDLNPNQIDNLYTEMVFLKKI